MTDRRILAADEQASVWCLRLSEGELTAADQAALETWLQADAAHGRALEDAVGAWQAIQTASASPELIVLRTQALEALRRSNQFRWTRSFNRLSVRIASCAAAVLVAAVAIGLLWANEAPQVYETGVGERRVAVLEDGSKVSLDAATKVIVHFDGDRRRLRLEHGRAKFDVAKDPLRPFSVAAADKLVVATGTEFSVELLRKRVHVILYEGRVSVLRQDGVESGLSSSSKSVRQVRMDRPLTPGRELVTDVAAVAAKTEPTDAARSLSWEAGQLVFADEPLSTAIERVNRYADTPFEIGDSRAGAVRISGVFTAGDSEAFQAGVTGIFPVRLAVVDGHHRFVSKIPNKDSASRTE